MTNNLKIELVQINFTVGDLIGNTAKIIEKYQKSDSKDLDLIVFSELAICGYPPEDLLHKRYFIKEVEEKINEICKITDNRHTAIIVGAPVSFSNKFEKNILYNCALLIENGEVQEVMRKSNIPNYGVFDEKRYFKEAPHLSNFQFRDFRLALLICEDIWSKKNAFLLADKKIDGVIVINASPFSKGKIAKRLEVAKTFNKAIQKPFIYVNQIGAQDSVVFDGSSFVLNKEGELVLQMKEFEEDQQIITIDKDGEVHLNAILSNKENEEDSHLSRIYNCLILGVRDYLTKNGFEKVVIGMSGGIDSAICAAIAVDAIGSQNVKLVALPSKFNSQESFDDANECSNNLGVNLEIISIEEPFIALQNTLKDQFKDSESDVTEENMQSRLRGNILMAISNKFNHLLLTTGNKSEMAVGYATIYGDMCGSLNPLKDVYKSEVFKLANWRNNNIPQISNYKKENIIPQNIITKEPTAELRDNQKDSDSLPEYEILDQILFNLIEEEKSVNEIIELGFEAALVKKVAKLLYNSEYKRKQAVIGLKVSKLSFDKDRRYQITNKFCH
jgi:NAD+ synthase